MGLTIHWELALVGDREAALAKVSQMRQKAMDMSFVEVSEVVTFAGDACDYDKRPKGEDEWRWALIQAQGNVTVSPDGVPLKEGERSYPGCAWISIKPVEAVLFSTWPGEGCEAANFGLCRYPASQIVEGKVVKTGRGRGWYWHSFCKTQYANEHGVMNFLRCHTLVIAMLDYAKEIGILKEVSDEGDYWEKRDLKALVEEIGRWDKFIAGFSAMLGKVVGEGNLESEIAKHPRYEKLKELGMQHLDERGMTQLKELFDAVTKKAKEVQ